MDLLEFCSKGGSAKTETKQAASRLNGLKGGRPANIMLNDDGVSIKGCSYIYAPKGQALEYAALASNPYRGCGHACVYCYVPSVLKIDRKEFNAGAKNRDGYLAGLLKDAKKYRDAGITEQVMLSFTSDPYHPDDTELTRKAIGNLHLHKMGVNILTKGGTRALRDIAMFKPERDCFGSTLTSLDDDYSRKWEVNAALPNDRINALKAFSEKGIFTWVSLEPTLDCESSLNIVSQTHEFVNLYKIGRANYLPMTKTTDWKDYTLRMIDLCQSLGVKHYIKKDLQCYLPDDYHNPLRIKQHF